GDYGAAGIPMLPNVAGEQATKVQILVYSLLLVGSSFLPLVIGLSGWLYGTVAVVSGVSLVLLAVRLLRTAEPVAMKKVARSLFVYSSSYLFVIFLALITDFVAHAMG